jgi:hypothetical protein
LIDITFAYDVALFFAEDLQPPEEPMPLEGAIFAIPHHVIGQSAELISLPSVVMRPNLQFGKFLRMTPDLLSNIDSYKYRYKHARAPSARGLSRPSFSMAPSIRDYMYPVSDQLKSLAEL